MHHKYEPASFTRFIETACILMPLFLWRSKKKNLINEKDLDQRPCSFQYFSIFMINREILSKTV